MKELIILVSHDRYFVNKTANKIWEIEDHKIKEFVGSYDELETWKQERKAAANENSKKKEVAIEKKVIVPVEKKSNDNSRNKEIQKELQKAQKRFQQIEAKLEQLKKEKNILETNLALPGIYSDSKKFIDAEDQYNKKSAELKNANEEYEKLFEKIMEMESAASI